MKTYFLKIFTIVFVLCGLSSAHAEVRLPKIVADGMILQRDQLTKIWGWASPFEDISVSFADNSFQTKADKDGNWAISCKAQKAGGPFEFVIKGQNNQIRLKDVYFGDVFLCSGQSNMELWMGRLKYQYPEEVKNAQNNLIRQFLVPDEYQFKGPNKDLSGGKWIAVSPQSIQEFSGVAYFFAKAIYQKFKVPVGIINAALGGSPIESWLSENTLKSFPTAFQELQKFKNDIEVQRVESRNQALNKAWYQFTSGFDAGNKSRFSAPNFNDSEWKSVQLPGFLPSSHPQGVYWLRKKIKVPESMLGKSALLELGRMVDADSVFVNGKLVGQTSYQYPPRRYPLPADVLQAGENTVLVRLICSGSLPEFVADKRYELTTEKDTVALSGEWKYTQTVAASPIPPTETVRWKPAGLFNAMIAPIQNFSIKAVLWYQGESNVSNAVQYGDLLKSLVMDWRSQFNQPDLPVLVAQLPNFLAHHNQPTESSWAVLRQQQLNVLDLPGTGVTNNIDLGDWNDIHPENKLDVANRFARLAFDKVYHLPVANATGPIVSTYKKEGNALVLSFSNALGGLYLSDKRVVRNLAIADSDRKFTWASADIQGDKIRVWANPNMKIKHIRYAWADNPMPVNVYNREGLPVFPFEMEVE